MSLDRLDHTDATNKAGLTSLSVEFPSQKASETKSANIENVQKLVDNKILPQCDFFDSCSKKDSINQESQADARTQGTDERPEKPDDRKYAPKAEPAPKDTNDQKPSDRIYNRPVTTEEYERQVPGIPVKPVDNTRYLPPTK